MKEMINSEANALQRSVHDTLCDAAGGFKTSFVDVAVVVDRGPRLNFRHSKFGELACSDFCLHLLQIVRHEKARQGLPLKAGAFLLAIRLGAQRLHLLGQQILEIIMVALS